MTDVRIAGIGSAGIPSPVKNPDKIAAGGFDSILNDAVGKISQVQKDAETAVRELSSGGDVTSAVPQLAARLSDAEADVRKMAAWALYRIAKYVGSIAAAAPALKALAADAGEEVRDMAAEALRAEEGRADA